MFAPIANFRPFAELGIACVDRRCRPSTVANVPHGQDVKFNLLVALVASVDEGLHHKQEANIDECWMLATPETIFGLGESCVPPFGNPLV